MTKVLSAHLLHIVRSLRCHQLIHKTFYNRDRHHNFSLLVEKLSIHTCRVGTMCLLVMYIRNLKFELNGSMKVFLSSCFNYITDIIRCLTNLLQSISKFSCHLRVLGWQSSYQEQHQEISSHMRARSSVDTVHCKRLKEY